MILAGHGSGFLFSLLRRRRCVAREAYQNLVLGMMLAPECPLPVMAEAVSAQGLIRRRRPEIGSSPPRKLCASIAEAAMVPAAIMRISFPVSCARRANEGGRGGLSVLPVIA
ncbi:MAG: hypothetical protein HPM95_09670 [Alphaproteobacteria bacterium]|nr:hypothetical protein [Alphaproteobacteria bacterium]